MQRGGTVGALNGRLLGQVLHLDVLLNVVLPLASVAAGPTGEQLDARLVQALVQIEVQQF